MLRIVLSAFGSRGDTQPFVLLAAELIGRGHEAMLCGAHGFSVLAEQAGVPYVGFGHGEEEPLPSPLGPGQLRELMAERAERSTARFATVAALARGADLVIGTGVDATWRAAAEAVGAPARFVAFAPTLFPSRYHAPAFLGRPSLGPRLNRMMWRLYGSARVTPRLLNERRAQRGLPDVQWALPDVTGLDLCPLLSVDEALATPPPDLAGRVVQVPAIVPRPSGTLPADLEEFLCAGEPPVYIGFGSMPSERPAKVTKWVLGAVRGLGLRAVVSRGRAGIGREGTRDVFVAGDVPHALLFPRCSIVVHHAGAGTTAVAARAGVPQVAVPHVGDQPYWAERLAELRVAPEPLPLACLSAAGLADRLKAVLADAEGYRFRAEVLAERLRGRDGAAEAADVLLA